MSAYALVRQLSNSTGQSPTAYNGENVIQRIDFGKGRSRFLLYVGIALAVLAVFAAAIVLSKGTVGRLSGAWMGLVVFTFGLFWVVVRQSKEYWRRPDFWLAIVSLLALHLLAFVSVLRVYHQWREIWFVPVVVVEGGLFGAILYLLFGSRRY